MSDTPASLTPADRNLTLIATLIEDPCARPCSRRCPVAVLVLCIDWTDRRIHLAWALPAAITSAFINRGWLARAPGRSLRIADGFDDKIDEWLAT